MQVVPTFRKMLLAEKISGITLRTEAALPRYTFLDPELKEKGYLPRCATKKWLVSPHVGCEASWPA